MIVTKLNPLTTEFAYKSDEPIELLLASDVHFDNPKCRRDIFFRHLNEAKKRGAKVAIFGDLFCLMQGKYDPRRSKKDIRPEHNKANYLDAVIDDTATQLEPYADTIVFVSEGNHETAILKNCETDILERFVAVFNDRYGAKVVKGGYRGWIIIRRNISPNSDRTSSYKMYYHHGYGGGGEMTKGILQHSRMNMHIENADAIIMGHVHEQYIQIGCTEYFDCNSNTVKTRDVYNIRTACYKDEFGDSNGGFHIERGRAPKPLGAVYCSIKVACIEKGKRKFIPTYSMWL